MVGESYLPWFLMFLPRKNRVLPLLRVNSSVWKNSSNELNLQELKSWKVNWVCVVGIPGQENLKTHNTFHLSQILTLKGSQSETNNMILWSWYLVLQRTCVGVRSDNAHTVIQQHTVNVDAEKMALMSDWKNHNRPQHTRKLGSVKQDTQPDTFPVWDWT